MTSGREAPAPGNQRLFGRATKAMALVMSP
jgi:hypothetical protein